MKICSLLNLKGGCGKTTLSSNLARALQLDGEKVILIDSDPVGSLRDWHAAGSGDLIPVIGLDRNTLSKDIKALTGFDWAIIDGAPQLTDISISALKCSDIVLIPVQPSPYDVWATSDLVDLIKERQKITDGRPRAAFVISRQISNTILGKEIRNALNDYSLPVFSHGTFQRIIYPKSAATGSTVLDSGDTTASNEIKNILVELKEFSK